MEMQNREVLRKLGIVTMPNVRSRQLGPREVEKHIQGHTDPTVEEPGFLF